jgi:hypothetical protein
MRAVPVSIPPHADTDTNDQEREAQPEQTPCMDTCRGMARQCSSLR